MKQKDYFIANDCWFNINFEWQVTWFNINYESKSIPHM